MNYTCKRRKVQGTENIFNKNHRENLPISKKGDTFQGVRFIQSTKQTGPEKNLPMSHKNQTLNVQNKERMWEAVRKNKSHVNPGLSE